ncbi:CHAT domain-containing protein [Actinoplanes sp. G11-F43]|uniref:CHAT domain-containing protein n=1 Tax=Actinoplanes sp. G11-F43 TaxID=3424130 RepID=UPI003D325EFF
MNVEIEFTAVLDADGMITFGLAGSGVSRVWRCAADEQAVIDALDRVPWGPQPAGAAETVHAVGTLLRGKLATADPVRHALTEAFAGAAGIGGVRAVRFVIGDPAVEAVPFETLWDEPLRMFPGLDPRWTIARSPAGAVEPPGPFTMTRAVRLVAILAAEGEDGGPQLEALRAAVAGHPGLPVEATVITSSFAMKAKLDEEAAPGWTAELVPASAAALIERLRMLRPQLLHIFCHGTAAGPRLLISQQELATLELTAGHLAELARPAGLAPWLTTLNCCESAAPGETLGSIAAAVVRSGLPAALGMRRPVSVDMAGEFCADLYHAVVDRLATVAGTGRTPAELDWARVLTGPRSALCTRIGAVRDVAGRQREWTLPVLYLAAGAMRIRGRPTGDLDDAAVDAQVAALSFVDGLERAGNLLPGMAGEMRRPSLDLLYPEGRP